MTSKAYASTGKIVALLSFIIGLLIFGTYYFTTNSDLFLIGYGFIAIAGTLNLLVLVALLMKAQSDTSNRKTLLKTVGLMLLNIPVMLACIGFTFILLNNMRITFTNGTQHQLTDITILGCETKHVKVLEPNASKTVWIGIPRDCSIIVEYLENGERKSETVTGYVTGGMGDKVDYQISTQN